MKSITKVFYENFLISLWNDLELTFSYKLNRLNWFMLILKESHPEWSEEIKALSLVLQKKENLLFLEVFEQLNTITKEHPNLLPELIAQDKAENPELYDTEMICKNCKHDGNSFSTLECKNCIDFDLFEHKNREAIYESYLRNEQSQANNEIDKTIDQDDPKQKNNLDFDCAQCRSTDIDMCMQMKCKTKPLPKHENMEGTPQESINSKRGPNSKASSVDACFHSKYEKEQGREAKSKKLKNQSSASFVGLVGSLSLSIQHIEIKGFSI